MLQYDHSLLLHFRIYNLVLNRIYPFTLLTFQCSKLNLIRLSRTRSPTASLKFLPFNPVSKSANSRSQFLFFFLPPYPTATYKVQPHITNGRGQLSLLQETGWVSSNSQPASNTRLCKQHLQIPQHNHTELLVADACLQTQSKSTPWTHISFCECRCFFSFLFPHFIYHFKEKENRYFKYLFTTAS